MKKPFSTIIGHKSQCDYLLNILESGKIAHGLCFSGSKGLGKATIAKEFAAYLLGLEVEKLQTSPNVTIVETGVDGKAGISVDQIRDLKQTLSLSTFGGGWKIAIIDGADTMKAPAQNALLKTLEEPTPQTLIILVSHNSNSLLETIKSRVATIEFRLLPVEQISKALQDRLGVDQEKAEFISQLSMGRAGIAFSCSDEENCKQQEDLARDALKFLQDPLYARMKKIEELAKLKDGRQQTVQNMVELMRMWLHEALLGSLGLECSGQVKDLYSKHSKEQIKNALQALHKCEIALAHNVGPALALQVFASSF